MRPVLSVAITVYNQLPLVRECINSIISYQGSEIEIIVGDDCSTEAVEELVDSYKDRRIRYHRNQTNLGHDLNIISTLRECKAPFVMLLRSRDKLFGPKIPDVLECIKRNRDAAYFLFSALDEAGNIPLAYSNKCYTTIHDKINAHRNLLVHPSGSIYNRHYLQLDIVERYIKEHFNNIYGFCAHDLMRMSLINKGDFVTSGCFVWQYTRTDRALDIAVNSSPKRISVYAPFYEYPRFRCQFEFAENELPLMIAIPLEKSIIKRFYKSILVDFKYANKDVAAQRHYNYNEIPYNNKAESRLFKSNLLSLVEALPVQQKISLMTVYYIEKIKAAIWYPFKRILVGVAQKSSHIGVIVKIAKRL